MFDMKVEICPHGLFLRMNVSGRLHVCPEGEPQLHPEHVAGFAMSVLYPSYGVFVGNAAGHWGF